MNGLFQGRTLSIVFCTEVCSSLVLNIIFYNPFIFIYVLSILKQWQQALDWAFLLVKFYQIYFIQIKVTWHQPSSQGFSLGFREEPWERGWLDTNWKIYTSSQYARENIWEGGSEGGGRQLYGILAWSIYQLKTLESLYWTTIVYECFTTDKLACWSCKEMRME